MTTVQGGCAVKISLPDVGDCGMRYYIIIYTDQPHPGANIVTIIILSPEDIVREISRRARSLRLLGAMTQVELAARAGVTLASLRRFERTGEASFGLVAKIASALRVEGAFDALFQAPAAACLDEAMARSRPVRRRGRRKEGAA